jgi:glycosyltransferase 2 family protein
MAMARARLERWMPLLRAVGFGAGVALIVVTGIAAARSVDTAEIRWAPLAAALVPAMAWWLGLARLWSVLVAGRWAAPDASTWCRTQVMRYLPGGFWAPASRLAVVHGTALDRFTVVVAENVIALCAALAIGGIAMALVDSWWWALLVPALVVPVLASRRLPRRLDPARTLDATGGAVVAFVAYVICAVLVQSGVSGWHEPVAVAGAAAIAWAAGLVVVIAPGGLGVREVVYIGLMGTRLSHGEPATGAVALRLVTIVAELAVFIVVARPRRAERAGATPSVGGGSAHGHRRTS